MSEEKISRLKFLRTVGFGGPALMALLAACKTLPDNSVPSLILDKNGNVISALGGTASTDTTGNNGGSGGGNGGLITGTVSTADLNKITNSLFKIDLASSNASNLKQIGGYVIVNNLYVVGRASNGDYVAATNLCSHEPRRNVILNSNGGSYYCSRHGAQFSLTGTGLNSTGRNGITVYRTANDGKTLVVY